LTLLRLPDSVLLSKINLIKWLILFTLQFSKYSKILIYLLATESTKKLRELSMIKTAQTTTIVL